MSDWAVYPPLHAVVQAARTTYYANRHSREKTASCSLTFEQLYERFCNKVADFNAIAVEAGIHPHSLDKLYDNNFAPLFKNLSSVSRRHLLKKSQREEQEKKLKATLPELPSIKLVASLAEKAGHTVEAVLQTNQKRSLRGVSRIRVNVSGTQCRIRPLVTPLGLAPGRKQRFARPLVSRTTLQEDPIQLFPNLIQGCYWKMLVVPSRELLEWYFPEDKDEPDALFYIPLKRADSRYHHTFNFHRFIERWDLIPRPV